MDSATPTSLFKDTTNVKSIKQDLSVFVSIGGWSFSDNNTATQPLFGEISADAAKRNKFANNMVRFMRQYGMYLIIQCLPSMLHGTDYLSESRL